MNSFLLDPSPIIALPCPISTHSLTKCCCGDLFDEDEVVDIVADVEIGVEESDGNSLTTAFS